MRRFTFGFHRLWKKIRRVRVRKRSSTNVTETSTHDILYKKKTPSQPPSSKTVIVVLTPFTCEERFLQELQVAELVFIKRDKESICDDVNTESDPQTINIAISEREITVDPSEEPGCDLKENRDCRILFSILNDGNYNISPDDREVLESIVTSPMMYYNRTIIYERESYLEGGEDKELNDHALLMSILNSGHYDILPEDQEAIKYVLACLYSFTSDLKTTLQKSD